MKESMFSDSRPNVELKYLFDARSLRPEATDKQSQFLNALTNDGSVVGIIRGTALHRAFPNREHFSNQISEADMIYLEREGFTLNCLAVEKHYRGLNLKHKGVTYKSVGQALVSHMLQRFFDEDYKICVVSAFEGASAKICIDVGFQMFGASFVSVNSNRRLMNLFLINPSAKSTVTDEFRRFFLKLT